MLDKELPDNPLPLLKTWLDEAWEFASTPNPNAMILSTVDTTKQQGEPSARVVLAKAFEADKGYIVFYTNYESRKGRELLSHQRASGVFFWDAMGRQARLEGAILQSPAEESDRYFATRSRQSQISAWASQQSRTIASREQLILQLDEQRSRFAEEKNVPRPAHWGGFRLWIERLELWSNGEHRLHDRAVWHRTLPSLEQLKADSADATQMLMTWSVQRLQP